MVYLEIKENKTILEHIALYIYYTLQLGLVMCVAGGIYRIAKLFATMSF